MDRATAIKKLSKRFGKAFGYRINDKAPTPEEREAARAELPAVNERLTKLKGLMDARHEAILKADAEYQELRAAWKAVQAERERLAWKPHHYKITVGTTTGMFFVVKAGGDSWEEVFDKLAEKEAA